ncbi:MAG: GIY-YIG nuclease family protein [Eubacteriales bacterium]|nr:GIY-YIG nuclease family protein [Eubacteriales bacterium]
MEPQRKKQLRENFKNRHPDMGVLAITCTATGDSYLFISKDAATGFNRHTFQLGAGMHPNKALQALWNQYGEAAFTLEPAGLIEYDDPTQDQTEKLEALLEACLTENPRAKRL